ncbi:alpha/beta hydrolase [Pantoea sp. 1.19]|uniref:alpha/beta hydrolase n=1 Tax=Pantoea sp. 1.19 TaxID=1925589 RepID=UPI0009FB27F1|nr:alpha/beta hydrolase [Pantoea sp. 1.19]
MTDGAEIIMVKSVQDMIDYMDNLTYPQAVSTRAVRPLRMSLLVPRTTQLKPAILYVPGGGFISAEYGKYIEMRMALAAAGFVVAAAEYRVIPDTFPAPVVDGKAAVRFLRQHAAPWGIDPQRIGVLGDSAGGWLAQMLAMTNGETAFEQGDFTHQSSSVQVAVSLYGISDLRNIGAGFPDAIQRVHQSPAVTEALLVHGPAFGEFAGATIHDSTEKALRASPIGWLSGPKPPLLILHGSADTLVSPQQSATLYQVLIAAGSPVEYRLVAGAGHGDLHWFQPATIDRVVAWFRQTPGAPVTASQ